MKDFPAAFQRKTESYEFSLHFCSLQDAEQAARDLIDFLMAGVRPKKETPPEPPKEAKERQRTIPRGPIADDLNRYMNEHAYSERDMAKSSASLKLRSIIGGAASASQPAIR